MKAFIFALCIAAASAGAVDHVACDTPGTGRLLQARVEGCSGAVCVVDPGVQFNAEADFTPAEAAESLTLIVEANYLGAIIPIIREVIPGSNVTPGNEYTIAFFVTPSTLLSGQQVPISLKITHTDTEFLGVCGTIQVRVN